MVKYVEAVSAYGRVIPLRSGCGLNFNSPVITMLRPKVVESKDF